MELRQLRYLVALAEERNFTRAAENEHVAQPALTQQSRRLEDEVGLALVERTTRRASLTDAGELLVVRARRVLAELEAADGEPQRARLARARGSPRPRARIRHRRPGRTVNPRPVADDEAAVQSGGDVVRVALQLDGQRADVGVELEQVIGGHQTRDDRGGTGTQAAAQRDLRRDPELKAVGRMQRLERAHDQIAAVERHIQRADHSEGTRLHHLQLQVQREGGRQHVEAGTQVRRGGRYAHQPPAPERHPRTARSIAPSSGSDGTTPPAWASAVWGSLRQWPVSTQATR